MNALYCSALQADFSFNMNYINEMGTSQDIQKTIGIPMGLVHGDLWTNNLLFRSSLAENADFRLVIRAGRMIRTRRNAAMNCWRLSTGKYCMQAILWKTSVDCLSQGELLRKFVPFRVKVHVWFSGESFTFSHLAFHLRCAVPRRTI